MANGIADTAADSEMKNPISRITNDKLLQLSAPPQGRMLLQPAHGNTIVPQTASVGLPIAPGPSYIPAPASVNALGGIGPNPPDRRGISTIAPGTYIPGQYPQPVQPAVAPQPTQETAAAVGKPVAGAPASALPTLTETPARGSIDFNVMSGPLQPTPSRFVPTDGGRGLIINPVTPGIVGEAERRGIGIGDTGPVPGGNVTQSTVDPATQARIDAEQKAWDEREANRQRFGYLSEQDKANMLEGAHGPRAAAKVHAQIAAIDQIAAAREAAGTTADAKRYGNALEAEKTKAEIANIASTIQGRNVETAMKGSFDRNKFAEEALKITKGDPNKAGWLTDIAERRHNKTGKEIATKLSVFNPADGSPVELELYGVVDKKRARQAENILAAMNESSRKYADSGFLGIGKNRETYVAQYDEYMKMLQDLGIRPVTSGDKELL